jgi:hypothetical protein
MVQGHTETHGRMHSRVARSDSLCRELLYSNHDNDANQLPFAT